MKFVELAPAALGGDHERPVLDEGAAVDEVVDVLAGGAVAAPVAALDRLGAGGVEPDGVALDHLGRFARRSTDASAAPSPSADVADRVGAVAGGAAADGTTASRAT